MTHTNARLGTHQPDLAGVHTTKRTDIQCEAGFVVTTGFIATTRVIATCSNDARVQITCADLIATRNNIQRTRMKRSIHLYRAR